LIPVGFGYGDVYEFFLWGWVWDNETSPHPTPLSSLVGIKILNFECVVLPPRNRRDAIPLGATISTIFP